MSLIRSWLKAVRAGACYSKLLTPREGGREWGMSLRTRCMNTSVLLLRSLHQQWLAFMQSTYSSSTYHANKKVPSCSLQWQDRMSHCFLKTSIVTLIFFFLYITWCTNWVNENLLADVESSVRSQPIKRVFQSSRRTPACTCCLLCSMYTAQCYYTQCIFISQLRCCHPNSKLLCCHYYSASFCK